MGSTEAHSLESNSKAGLAFQKETHIVHEDPKAHLWVVVAKTSS